MIKLLGSRGASAVMGFVMLAAASSASAQDMSALSNVSAAVKAVDVCRREAARHSRRPGRDGSRAPGSRRNDRDLDGYGRRSSDAAGAERHAEPGAAVFFHAGRVALQGGWPLYALVDKFATSAQLDQQTSCLATAVYFEARGESLEGQLAVAHVVMNRAASGRYPSDWCSVVKQPAQFSFVRHGEFPQANTNCDAWRKAEAIAQLAAANIVPSIGPDVLWYHANYVAPSWGVTSRKSSRSARTSSIARKRFNS